MSLKVCECSLKQTFLIFYFTFYVTTLLVITMGCTLTININISCNNLLAELTYVVISASGEEWLRQTGAGLKQLPFNL